MTYAEHIAIVVATVFVIRVVIDVIVYFVNRKRKFVRCRKCKHFLGGGEINNGLGLCMRFYCTPFWHTVSVKENDFCSKGERK